MTEVTTSPPESETGVEMPTVGLGWLKGTYRGHPDEALHVLGRFFGAVAYRPSGTRWYRASATLMSGRVLVAWDGVGSAAGTVMVDVSQTALDHLGWDDGILLASMLDILDFRPSRIDVYLDDRQRLADPADVYDAMEAGDAVTHAKGHERHQGSIGSYTTYVGSRESERYLRVYRKDYSTDDPRTRWELEIKGEAARDALRLLLATTDPTTQPMDAIAGLIIGFVDFRARAGLQHGSRADRLPWWAALIGSLTGVRRAVARRIDDLARRAGWFRRQVAPTLAVLLGSQGYGNVWMTEVLHEGRLRAGGKAWAAN